MNFAQLTQPLRRTIRRSAAAAMVLLAAAAAAGQTAPKYLISTNTNLTTPSSFGGPNGNMATDQFGDLFVPDAANSKVYEFPANGGPAITIFDASKSSPQVSGVAVDAANNLYVTTRYDGSLSATETDIFKFPYNSGYPGPYVYTGAAPGVCSATSTGVCAYGGFLQTTGYYYQPQAIAFDGAGNGYMITAYDSLNKAGGLTIFACDVQCGYNNDVATIAVQTLPTTATSLAAAPNGDLYYADGKDVYYVRAGSGKAILFDTSYESQYGGASGVGFDRAGNLYVSNSGGTYEVPYLNGAIIAGNKFQVAITTAGAYTGPAVDNNGNVFMAAYSSVQKTSLFNYSFGASAVGTAVAPPTFTLTFLSPGTLSSLTALQSGTASNEFTLAPGTCVAGTFAAGSSCTFTVAFTPAAVGTRRGTVVMTDSTGFQTTLYLAGVGQGTGITVDPGTPTAVSTTLKAPSGLAVDASGNVFVADAAAAAVYEYAGGTGTPVSIGSGYSKPTGVAVDGGGNVYVVDQAAGKLLLFTNTAGKFAASAITLATGLTSPTDIVISGAGSIYLSNTGSNVILQYPNASRIGSLGSSVGLGINLKGPTGLSLDPSGNLYIADTGNNRAVQVTYSGAQTAFGSGFNAPTGVTAEPSGSVLIADQGNGRVVRVPNEAGTLTTADQVTLTTPVVNPYALRLTSAGNLFLTDNQVGMVEMLQRTAGTLSFGINNVNTASSAQTVVVSSSGTADLTLASPFFVAPPVSSNFTLTTGSGSTGCAAGTLGSGRDCILTSVFDPTSTGTKTYVENFNAVAANSAAPSITLTGLGVQLVGVNVALVKTSPTGSVTFGVPVVFTATVASSSSSSTAVPTGSVIFNVDGQNSKPVALTNGTATLTLTGLGGNTTHSVIATYTGGAVYASGSSSPVSINVVPGTLAATLSVFGDAGAVTPLSATPGNPVSFSVAIVPSVVVSGALTGTVNFYSGNILLGSSSIGQNSTTLAYSAGISVTTLNTLCPVNPSAPGGNLCQVSAVFTGNGNYSGFTTPAIPIYIVASTYSVVASSNTITSTAAQYGSTTLTISSYSGFQGGVSLSCTGLPANAYCVFNPGLISLTTTGTGTPIVTTQMEIRVSQDPTTIKSTSSLGIFGLVSASLLLLLAGTRRRLYGVALTSFVVMFAMVLTTALSGCGSTSTMAYPTPAGTYPVTLVATSSPLTSGGQPPSVAGFSSLTSANGVVIANFPGYSGVVTGQVLVAGVTPGDFNGTFAGTVTSVAVPNSNPVAYFDQLTYAIPNKATLTGSGGYARQANQTFTQAFTLIAK